ncbi:MAG: RRXRR domain-containing protein, partial [Bradyrhizobiaceae bacterium]|nr:RRXRR domain-containing protein [Bradyrhizobiaceae bacterium]
MTEKFKTNVRMPTQFGPLEGHTVDNPGDRDETGVPVTLLGNIGESGAPQGARYMARKGNSVFVLDKHKKPLMPCSRQRARLLLECRRAVIHRRYPFTLRLKDRVGGDTQPLSLKLDPGSRVTGVALVREAFDGQHVLHLAEIEHRGKTIRKHMLQRAMFRRRRRSANLRYRAKRFGNRVKPTGWLPPSLRSRVDNSTNWVRQYRRLAPIVALSVEHARFDMQQMVNPEISGVEYQQGELAGYEVREYLLQKFDHACAYCGVADVPLNIDHVTSRARGGSNRVSNLVVACVRCNQAKGSRDLWEFLAHDPALAQRILTRCKAPLKDAAAVNATRWALVDRLRLTGLPIELSSGGRTKWNRTQLGIPKEHCLDAACVGIVSGLHDWNRPVQQIKCTGRGSYQRTRLTAHGFPRGYLTRAKTVRGFQTGDMVRASVPTGKKAGTHTGRVAVRATGSFNIQAPTGVVQGISWKHCTLLSRADGHSYHLEHRSRRLLPTDKSGGIRR